MSKASTYDKTATESKTQTAIEAKGTREGKQYAYQPPRESAAAAPSKVEEQKQKVVSAFDDFMDALADHVAHAAPSPADASPGTTPGPAAPGAASSSGVVAPGPGYSAPRAGAGYATPSTGTPPIQPPPTTTPAAGSEMTTTEAAAVEAAREANEVASQRSAYLMDRARESEKRNREQGSASARVVKEAGGLYIRTETNKHTSDSNRSPLTESANWESSYGTLGKGVAPTIEVAVPNKRPETVPAAGTSSGPRPIDAWYGSFGNAIEKAKARAKANQLAMEKIIGPDDRVRVTNNEAYPWRCICSLLITANTGAQYIGTGWLVAPRLLLTAGHCVFMSDEGGWVSQIEVIPGRDADERPYGSTVSREVRSVTGWTQDNDSNYDYGAIILPADKRYGDQLGWFGYANRPDDYLRNLTLNLSGYPGDGGKAGIDGTQWYHSRTVMQVLERQLTYDIDTFGGQSGAPVWEYASNGSRYGVAIHTFGDTLNNGGTRITSGVFSNVADWVGEAP